MMTATTMNHHHHRNWVGERGFDLVLDGDRLLLIDRQPVQQNLQDAACFAGFN